MLFRRYTFYVLFSLAYIGFLILEKPYFSINGSWLSYLPTFLVHFSLMVFMVLANNRILIPYLLEKKRFVWYVLSLVVLIASFTFIRSWYHKYIYEVLFHDKPGSMGVDYANSFVYGDWFLVVATMLYITQQWSEQREQLKNIHISQLQTELKYLRSQINPHFLFNGLNTIYSRIDMNNHDARDIVVQFSDLLRYNLYEADIDLVALEKEIKFLQNYVGLQKARTNDNVKVDIKIDHKNGSLQIAPLIFMPFVENAFKYVSRKDDNLNYITVTLIENDGRIDFKCENSFEEADVLPAGIGLNNVLRRLELLYKETHELKIKTDNTIFTVHLILNL